MSRELKDLVRRVEEFYVTSTGRLSYPVCQSLRETEYPALAEELERLRPELAAHAAPVRTRLEEARANLEAQLERYEAINREWNLSVRLPELRRRLH